MLWTVPLFPVAGAAAATLFRRKPAAMEAACLAGIALGLAAGTWAAVTQPVGGWSWGPVLELRLAAEGFARIMAVLVPAVALPVTVYAAATEHEGRTRLLVVMTAFVAGMELVVLAGDFLTLLVGWEVISAASWALIGHGWHDPDNPRFATHAFVTTRFGDLGLYVAAGMTFAATGSFEFGALAGAGRPLLDVITVGVLLAAAAKSAQVPFSPWLFSAMAGPTPVSALLHSATLVAAGAYALVRLGPDLAAVGWFSPAVVSIGLVTALTGGVVACMQGHAKRVLAGSTSAQYGLMFVAVGAGATVAAGAHLVTHALFKSLLFLAAGLAIHAAATSELRHMQLGSHLRVAAALSAVGAAALAAVPPLGGAWSKEMIVAAAVHASGWLGAGVLAAAFLTAVYASRFHLLAFGPGPQVARERDRPPGARAHAGLAWLAGGTVALSLLWLSPVQRRMQAVVRGTLPDVAWWEFLLSLGVIAAAFCLAVLLWQRGALATVGLPTRSRALLGEWFGLPRAARAGLVDPVLRLASTLARFDDRVVDAGVRGVAGAAARVSGLLSRRGEPLIDGVVRGVAALAVRAADASRLADERGVDVAVEGAARGIGVGGHHSRRLQTGLSHHYYLVIGVGLAVVAVVLTVLR